MTARVWSIVLGLAVSLLWPQSAKAVLYTLDPSRSELVVQLFKAGIGATLAHDHVVRATRYSGRIELDPAAPTAAQISIEVDATALIADEPETRQKYGLPLGLSAGDRQDIQRTLESETQLYVQRYPTIRFRSTHIAAEGEGRYLVTGDLELRGVTQTIALSLQAELHDGVLRGQGSGRFRQSRFGYQPYSAFWGAVQNQDEVVLRLDVVATRQ